MSTSTIEQIVSVFQPGTAVLGFTDNGHVWRLGTVKCHCDCTHIDERCVKVRFTDSSTEMYPYSTISVDDLEHTFLVPSEKSNVIESLYTIDRKVLVRIGIKYVVGKIYKRYWTDSIIRAIVIRVPGEDYTFLTDGFTELGEHPDLRLL